MRICRLCLYKGDDKQVLSVWNKKLDNLVTKIQNCVSIIITKEDALPTSVCLSCIHQVTQWEIFCNTCQKSNEILLKGIFPEYSNETKAIKQPVKVEKSPKSKKHPVMQESDDENEDELTNDHEEKYIKVCNYTDNDHVENEDWEEYKHVNDEKEKDIHIEVDLKDIEEDLDEMEEDFKDIDEHLKEVNEDLKDVDEEDKDVDEEDKDDDFDADFLDSQFKTEFIETIYKCNMCNEEFPNCFDYLDHQESHDGQFSFECDKCPELFNTRKELVEHDRNHRTPCPQCGKMILKASMKLHLIKHTDRHKCSQCNGRFNSRASLSQHVITVHTHIREHVCEICGKQFSSQTALRVHMRSHSDERSYPCKLCPYAGRTASAIYVHMATHSEDLCVCSICSKVFKSNRNLNDHLRRVHSTIKNHTCHYCGKKFVDKYMLRTHTRSHTGARPYKCTVCTKSFIRSDGLKEHIATHGQRILYDCKDCGKKFTTKRGITRHNCTLLK